MYAHALCVHQRAYSLANSIFLHPTSSLAPTYQYNPLLPIFSLLNLAHTFYALCAQFHHSSLTAPSSFPFNACFLFSYSFPPSRFHTFPPIAALSLLPAHPITHTHAPTTTSANCTHSISQHHHHNYLQGS